MERVCVRPVVECAIGTNAVGDSAVSLQLAGRRPDSVNTDRHEVGCGIRAKTAYDFA